MREAFITVWPYLRKHKRALALGLGALILKDGVNASRYASDFKRETLAVRKGDVLTLEDPAAGTTQEYTRVVE
mgnify:CR=1 FL=1